MPSIGSQCRELRINDENQTWRLIYHIAADAVAILDVFSKEDRRDTKRSFDELQKTPCRLHKSSFGRGRKAKMNALKKVRLQRAGWVAGDAAMFLNLNPQEAQFVELKLALAAGVRQLREQRGMTQAALAKQLGSSQSRIAKIEAADRSVTVDLMMRSLLAIGATPGVIAKLIKRVETRRAA